MANPNGKSHEDLEDGEGCVHFSNANSLHEPLLQSALQPHLLQPPLAPGPTLPSMVAGHWASSLTVSHHCLPGHHQAPEAATAIGEESERIYRLFSFHPRN